MGGCLEYLEDLEHLGYSDLGDPVDPGVPEDLVNLVRLGWKYPVNLEHLGCPVDPGVLVTLGCLGVLEFPVFPEYLGYLGVLEFPVYPDFLADPEDLEFLEYLEFPGFLVDPGDLGYPGHLGWRDLVNLGYPVVPEDLDYLAVLVNLGVP